MTDEDNNQTTRDHSGAGNDAGSEAAFWQGKLAEASAREAIRAEGGHIGLLMPHIMPTIVMERDADRVKVSCVNGGHSQDPASFIRSLRQQDGFSHAFDTPPEAAAAVAGSGAHASTVAPAGAISAGDPLAVGHALEAIARGERVLSD